MDIAWLDPSGREMTDETWNSPDVRCLGVRLDGDAIDEVDERGERIVGDTLLILLNAGDEPVPFTLPDDRRRPNGGKRCSTPPTRGRRSRRLMPAIATGCWRARWRC